MTGLFHLIFELIKIGIQSYIYALVLLFIFKSISKSNPENWFQKVTANKKGFLLRTRISIYLTLFCFMFSYWGNHGFGDSAAIPIGYNLIIRNIDSSEYGYIENLSTKAGKEIHTTQFTIVQRKLIGSLDSWFYSYQNAYFIYDMREEKMQEFKSQNSFNQYAIQHKLPTAEQLMSFSDNYHNRWSGWRFWLLP